MINLHQWDSGSEDEEAPGGDVGEALDDDDRLVAEEVGQEEDCDEDGPVGVGPHGIDVVVRL